MPMGISMSDGILLKELDTNSFEQVSFIDSLYSEEPYPIFEHNAFHVYASLSFLGRIFILNSMGVKSVVVVRNDNTVIFFSPVVSNWEEFVRAALSVSREYGQNAITIQNVSEHWVKLHHDQLIKSSLELIPRSKEEVVYSCDTLTSLSGSHFAKLRRVRKSLLYSNKIIFNDVTKSNLAEASKLLDLWSIVQGSKYAKNKLEREKSILKKACEAEGVFPDLIFKLGKHQGLPVSLVICVKCPSHPWAVNYLLKGLNRAAEGGLHGASDATYLYIAQMQSDRGITHINDGELGYELGTREHKLRFMPKMLLKSFDISFPLR